VISRRHFVVFRDSIFNLHVKYPETRLGAPAPYASLLLAPEGVPGGSCRSMIHKIRREMAASANSWDFVDSHKLLQKIAKNFASASRAIPVSRLCRPILLPSLPRFEARTLLP